MPLTPPDLADADIDAPIAILLYLASPFFLISHE
jgi:hypothetical protein